MKRAALVSAVIFLLILAGKPTRGEASLSPSQSSKIVKEVADRYWELLLNETVYFRQKAGIKVEFLPGFSFKSAQARAEKVKVLLERLSHARPEEITYDEFLTCRILEWVLENRLDEHRFFRLQFPIASYSSPIPDINRFYSQFEFKEKSDPQRYLRLLEQYADFIAEIIALLKQQYREKIIIPKPELKRNIAYLKALIRPADKSFLYVKQERLPAGIFREQKETALFREKVALVIEKRVNPKLKELLNFAAGDYYKAAPGEVGVWQYPRGREYYKFLVRFRTSLDLTPEEVHRTGLREIERLNKELDALGREVKFKGSAADFLLYLKSDPRFTPRSAREMGEKLTYYKRQAEAKLPLFFNKIPRAPCDVKRLNPVLESISTYGFYDPPIGSDAKGYYYYNASYLDKKNILNTASPSLILHELLPGHHFQVALQSEAKNLHPFRREFYITPYAEGWAEYAARLGVDMGIYKTPYERCSLIMQDLFMSVRLVVDSGMNYYRWPRKRAAEFMKRYLLQSEAEIESETLRYAVGIPGHALGYKIGGMKMLELRKKAEEALAGKFDIKEFHNVLLDQGTMPLCVLEEHVQRFLERQKAATKPTPQLSAPLRRRGGFQLL